MPEEEGSCLRGGEKKKEKRSEKLGTVKCILRCREGLAFFHRPIAVGVLGYRTGDSGCLGGMDGIR